MSFSVIDSIVKAMVVKPHPAGIPFIAAGAVLTVLAFPFSAALGLVPLAFTFFCLYFFRDPERVTPQGSSLLIAPADGLISAVVRGTPLPAEIAGDDSTLYTRISIFLSVLDVHVCRIPLSGKVLRKVYRPGKFLNADLDKASEDNERCSVLAETDDGRRFAFVQIAGLVARRIVNNLEDGQSLVAGARFGIIRFGSRVDVYIPGDITVFACVGQRAVGGETVLADSVSDSPDRTGKVV